MNYKAREYKQALFNQDFPSCGEDANSCDPHGVGDDVSAHHSFN
jgi:hypothetical protein